MSVIPVMLIVLGVIAACFLALLAYRGQLTRYEEDQLFLNETESNEQREQSEIVRKVNRLQPFVAHPGRRHGRHDRGHRWHLHLRRLATSQVA